MEYTPFFPRACASLLLAAVTLPGALRAQEGKDRLVRESDPLTPAQEQAGMHAPEGFTVQLFASEPMINKPINLAFDARGRLWVTSTVEYPYAASKQRWADPTGSRVTDSRDAVKILEDTDGDGVADKVTDFADGLNIPTGVLPWHKPEDKDGCIAWSIPNIWYFADSDGDGKCDRREILFGPLGYEKDTHGMCSSFRMGPDGWVYATHGFNNTSHLVAKDGSSLDLHSGNVFRFRPDGSRVEIWSRGQVNPFGLCWDRRGQLYSTDCHSNPITQLLQGAYYGSFGKPHDGLGFAPVICEHSHGSTGLCGIVYVDGGIWGPEWDDHIFVGNCVTSKVNHDLVTFTGTTPKANEKPDFLTSDDPWFRPVDLQLGPDNALYVADFYNRIIGHYEVRLDHPGRDRERGRIWRIAKNNASRQPRPAPPAARTFSVSELESSDPFTVRGTAAWLAVHPARDALAPLLKALAKVDAADAQLRHQLRIALRESLKLEGTYSRLDPVYTELLRDVSFAVPTADAARYLLAQWPPETERLLEHLARHADENTLSKGIAKARREIKPSVESTALAAMHKAFLEAARKPPREFLDWCSQTAESLLSQMSSTVPVWENVPHPSFPKSESPWCTQERSCADGKTAEVLCSLDKTKRSAEQLTGILRSVEFPAPQKFSFWVCGHDGNPAGKAGGKNLVRLTLEGKTMLEALPPRKDSCELVEWDLGGFAGRPVRLEVVDGDDGSSYAWIGISRIEPGVLSVASFDTAVRRDKQLRTLAPILRTTAPAGLRDKLAVYLPKAAPAPAAKPVPEVDALLNARRSAFAAAKTDASKGEAVFTANCAACHSIKGQGGIIGPQLDGVGSRGADRLIEDILDPNRNVDSHFRLHQIMLRDGSALAGFVRGEAGQTVLLVDATGTEHRVAKGDIAEDKEMPQSIMPPVFAETIPADAFNNLLAWLLK
jgi:putative heme-binding domain-containing protein